MSRIRKKVARTSLFAMIIEMWSEIHSGKVTASNISLTKYASKYHVGKFRKSLILPYLTQESCPTYEQACRLRQEISADINNRQAEDKDEKEKNNLGFEVKITPKEDFISQCIGFLKKEGYVIFKKV